MIDLLATQEHFLDHLAPLWRGLRHSGLAGRFITKPELFERARRRGIAMADIAPLAEARESGNHLLAASIGDVKTAISRMCPPAVALLEHGCGLSFTGDGRKASNHSGGHGARDFVSLFLMTNEWCARNDREAHPDARVVVCGSPRLDWLSGAVRARNDPPTICYATHWDCYTAPETRSALGWFWPALKRLSKRHRVIGHAHPRAGTQPWSVYKELGVEAVHDFQEVLERANLFIGDCGSAPYEFARSGRPVVVCNAPIYRRHVRHGLRFWECIPGLQCDRQEDLATVVDQALEDPPHARAMRDAANASVYPHFGQATGVAVAALEEWVNGR